MTRFSRVVSLLVALATTGTLGLSAQGVTGSALQGRVTQANDAPLAGASIRVRNTATGDVYVGTSRANGQFFIDFISPGSSYSVTVASIGFQPQTREPVNFQLGQRVTLNFTLSEQAVQLQDLTVLGAADARINQGRTGASMTISDSMVARLPLQGRNFTDLIATSPQVVGTSVAGQNNRFNNIQIDGGVNNDLFGLAGSGTPGGQSNAKPISVEAIKEFQVLVAPFDVRQGNFTGGLINAVTKSGTNTLGGSLFGYYQSKDLAGSRGDPGFGDFDVYQYGGTVGGPIIKDKLHFFASVDIQQRTAPFGNSFSINGVDAAADSARAGFSAATADRFSQILENTYGITDAGTWRSPSLKNPDRNWFGKLNWQVNDRNKVEFSYNLVDAENTTITRAPTSTTLTGRMRDGFALSGSGFAFENTTNTGRVKWTSLLGDRVSNEFLAGFSIIRDDRAPSLTTAPLILVKTGQIGTADAWLAAGAERFSQRNSLDQDVFQVQNNTTIDYGKHRLTLGTSNEFFSFTNVFLQAGDGVWAFNSLDDFENGTVAAFQRRVGISDPENGGVADFNVSQFGLYAQDEFQPNERLTITLGLRADVPFLSKGSSETNALLVNDPNLPIDTGDIPDGQIQWSPRFGFNYDVNGDLSTVVRGGLGIFSGRVPYVWYSNAFSVNGLSQVEFTCTGADVPVFSPVAANAPSSCLNQPPPTGGTGNQGEINYFKDDIKNPQKLRAALGLDHRLPWGVVGTVDLLYTKDVNEFYVTDENLNVTGTNGEGRTLYGTVTTRSGGGINVSSSRKSGNLRQAVRVSNKSEGRVYSSTFQLQKQFEGGIAVALGYTYSDAKDQMSLTSSQAFSNFQFAALDGTIADRNLRTSTFDRPHNISLSGTFDLPYGVGLSLVYNARSGTPYTWMVNGDVNADGINGNDLPFIPTAAGDILLEDPTQFGALDDFINSQECLANDRGRFHRRNSCRNPWQSFLNSRVQYTIPTIGKQGLQLQWDVFNLLNLIDTDWGLFKEVSNFEQGGRFLDARGVDPVTNKPIFRFTPPSVIERTVLTPTLSRWRMQVGARYVW